MTCQPLLALPVAVGLFSPLVAMVAPGVMAVWLSWL
jgi:hypothetical protein